MKEKRKTLTLSGIVTAVFAQRFVLENPDGKYLADIGRVALGRVALQEGDAVKIKGEITPSKIKVLELAKNHDKLKRLPRKGEHLSPSVLAKRDSTDAIAAVVKDGFEIMAAPRCKPKHFEILGRSVNGKIVEFHVAMNGEIRKKKSKHLEEAKWMDVIPVDHARLKTA